MNDDPRYYDADAGVQYRWDMPNSARHIVAEVDLDDDPVLVVFHQGPGWTRHVAFLDAGEAKWLGETMPQILAAIEVYQHRRTNGQD